MRLAKKALVTLAVAAATAGGAAAPAFADEHASIAPQDEHAS